MRSDVRCRIALAALLAGAVTAPPAGAQTGNGLYEPFPRPKSEQRARGFAERLPDLKDRLGTLRGEDLERGVVVGSAELTDGGARAASERATASADQGPDLGLALEIAILVLVLAGWPLIARGRSGSERRRGLGAAAAAACLAALVVAVATRSAGEQPAAPAAIPRLAGDPFVGVVSEDVFVGTPAYRRRALARQGDVGIGLIRQTFAWSRVETRPGRFDLSRLDRYVADLARAGMTVLPILFDPPRFRSSAPSRGARRGVYPPRRPADMGRFAAVLVRRYGPRGSLWTEQPELPRTPVAAWQVWNEPNIPFYWPTGPDPRAYTRLLAAVSRSVKAVDPQAEVVTAGLPQSNRGVPFERFVNGLYDAGAQSSFDSLAIHAYTRDAGDLVGAVAGARDLLRRRGDDAGLRVTEFGWATGGPPSEFTVGARGQAQRIGVALGELSARRGALGLRGVVYFNWRDLPRYPGGPEFFGLHSGLLDIRGRPKPGYAAFRQAATGR